MTGLSQTDGCIPPFLLLSSLTFSGSKAGCKPALRQNELLVARPKRARPSRLAWIELVRPDFQP